MKALIIALVLIGALFLIQSANASPIPSNDFQIKDCIKMLNGTLGLQNATLACQNAQFNSINP
jgi:hypothetical protein